jgi:hypothetical protein
MPHEKNAFHVGPEVVGQVLQSLAGVFAVAFCQFFCNIVCSQTGNTMVCLPSTCLAEVGLEPNINDKHKPKELVRTQAVFPSC